MKEKIFTSLTLLALGLLALSCKNEPPPAVQVPALELVAEDASCTEAWLRIRSLQVPATVQLLRDGQRVSDLRLLTSDSLVVDEGLLPRRTYTYKAQLLEPCLSGRQAQSANLITSTLDVQVTTMDTTSHAFSFQIDTLGDGGGSVLYDVAIVRADPESLLILAVGEIYHSDSSQSFLPFSVASWNGQTWQLKRVYYNGTNIITAIRGIWVAAPNDIWLAAGSVFHWDGASSQAQLSFSRLNLPDPNATIEKLWGSPELGLYGVGNAGTIVHRNTSGTWRRIESGTRLPIMDIWGARKGQSGEYEILCVAEAYGTPGASKIYSVENNTAHEIATQGLDSWGVEGIWFVPNREYIVVGQGVWRARSAVGRWSFDDRLPRIATEVISGQGLNDIVVCGSYWLLGHYNGVSWQTYFPRISGALGGIALKGNFLIAVGFIGDQAAVIRGRR